MPAFYRMMMIGCLLLDSAVYKAQQAIQWEPLGGPLGVKTISAMASDTAGSVFLAFNNEVYRSDDDGDSWTPCNDGLALPSGAETTTFFPIPDGRLYLRFYDGFYRYQPGIQQWAPLAFPANFQMITIDGQGRFWFIRGSDQIFFSTDEGQTLQQVGLNAPVDGAIADIIPFDDDHNLMLVNHNGTLQAFHFNLNGEVQLAYPDWNSFSKTTYNPYNGDAFNIHNMAFLRSVNGGLTWEPFSILNTIGNEPLIQRFSFAPNGTVWAHSLLNESFRSDDGGLTWAVDSLLQQQNGSHFWLRNGIWFHNRTCGYTETFGKSIDGGQTWTDLTNTFSKPTVYTLKESYNGSLYAQTCRNFSFECSRDSGQTWAFLRVDSALSVQVRSLATRPDGVMLGAGADGLLYRSVDYGLTWDTLPVGIPNVLPYGSDCYADRNGAFYISDFAGRMHRSVNDGETWTPLGLWSDYTGEYIFHPNGDIYYLNSLSVIVYLSEFDWVDFIHYEQQAAVAKDIHCTDKGVVFFSTQLGGGDAGLYRILPDGQYKAEPIPFFENMQEIRAMTSNALGDVYVANLNQLFRSFDDGDTWESLGTMPDYPITMFTDKQQYLYAGFSGNVIHRSAQPTTARNLVIGKVWLDVNANCLYEAGEIYPAHVPITSTGPLGYATYSGFNGQYAMALPDGDFLLNVKPASPLFEPCQTDVPISLTGANDSVYVDLPLRAAALCPYLRISFSAPIVRRCFDVTYTIQYKNEGTATATGAYVDVRLDSFYIFQNASLPVVTQNGLTYRFDLGDLQPNQMGSFQLTVNVSCDAALGQTHCMSAHIYPDSLCLPTLEQIGAYRECRENIGSYDPNDKQAFVNGHTAPGYVLPNTDVEYLIRFQNTGTDTAFRVVIEDRLPALLDVSSIVPLVASHAYTMTLDARNTLRFVFDNILLPDSNINEAASHGFVKFRVAQQPDVSLGSVIRNSADIFFDFNAPVRTNESRLTVGTVSIRPEPGNPYTISAYPNPFTDAVAFEISGPDLSGEKILRLVDALGRTIRQEAFSGHQLVLTRQGLQPGVYYFLIDGADGRIGGGTVVVK